MIFCRWRGADDKEETEHLLALAGGDEGRIRFFPCDLLDGAVMLAAARGCSGVFHLASPCTVDRVLDPQVLPPRVLPVIVLPLFLQSSVLSVRGGVCLVLWPQKELVVPAVEGTLNVLRAAKDAGGVRRVVVTSSVSAVVPNPGWPAGEVLDERCWTDIDYCDKNGVR